MNTAPAASDAVSVNVVVNGSPTHAVVAPRLLLSDFLRKQLMLTGTHVGCEHGVCGACTVLLNGMAVRSCLTLAAQCHGAEIETIEGVTASGRAADLQQAFSENHALQCGFCTPGFIVSALEIIEDPASAGISPNELKELLAGNLCRCTGYAGIIRAVSQAIAGRYKLAPSTSPSGPS